MKKQLKKIIVKRLFGFLDHTIELKKEGITFIHGPNGCGKTTILKLVNLFFRGNYSELYQINFDQMILVYEKDNYLVVEKSKKGKEINISIKDHKEKCSLILPSQTQLELFLENFSPKEREIARTARKAIGKAFQQVIEAMKIEKDEQPEEKENDPSKILQKYHVNVQFIETERIIKQTKSSEIKNLIQEYSDEIKSLISSRLAEYTSKFQSKKQSFAARLLSMEPYKCSEEKIRDEYIEAQQQIQRLINTGLIVQEENFDLPDRKLTDTEKTGLILHLEDCQHMIEFFKELLIQIEVFLKIVSSKLKNKKFEIDREKGFIFKATQGAKEILQLSNLSSGEQHQVALFYRMIFHSKQDTFFLVDEPEISLHVDWQRQFIEDIHHVIKLKGVHFLIATHSPQIVGSRRDLAISLEGGILNV